MTAITIQELSASHTFALILFLIFLLTALLRRAASKSPPSGLKLPPSPPSLPVIGHLHLLSGDLPHRSLQRLALRYGPILFLRLGSVPAIAVSSSSLAHDFLKTHDYAISSRPKTALAEILTHGFSGFIFAPMGPFWRSMKRLCVSELLGPRSLECFQPARQEEIRSFLMSLMESAGEPVNVGERLMILAGNIVSRMTVNKSLDEKVEWWDMWKETSELAGEFYIGDFLGFMRRLDLQRYEKRCRELTQRLDAAMEKILREHEERIGQKRKEDEDIIDMLLRFMDDDKADVKLTRENIKVFIQDIFVAGMDTVALTMQWGIAELIRHPTILGKAQREIDSAIGRSKLVEESDVPNLPYLQAIVKETLRLHPVAPLLYRATIEDFMAGAYRVGANWRVFVNLWAIGRDPDIWDQPLEFLPERFLGSDIDVRGQHFELTPFGSGRRMCPGASLALHVLHTALAGLIQCFDWEVDGGADKIDMEEGRGLTMPMAHPLVCRPVPRFNPFLHAAYLSA